MPLPPATLAAAYLPPEPGQAFLQGGTFVFRGPATLLAHYDPSTAAHASVDDVAAVAVAVQASSGPQEL
jgi:hypothetical protein